MHQSLNRIEATLLVQIVNENKGKYPFLSEHISYLRIKNRQNTGVGIYTNLDYTKSFEEGDIDDIITSNKVLRIKGLKEEVAYVLDIHKSKINFLEIVTNGHDVFIEGKFDYDFELY